MATIYWNGAVSSEWGDPINWSTGCVPGPGDDVVIDKDCTIRAQIGDLNMKTKAEILAQLEGMIGGTETIEEIVAAVAPHYSRFELWSRGPATTHYHATFEKDNQPVALAHRQTATFIEAREAVLRCALEFVKNADHIEGKQLRLFG